MKTTRTKPTRFQETLNLPSTRNVDRVEGVIKDVKVLGLESRNGRRYSKDAIAKAKPLYESVKVCIDHSYDSGGKQRRTDERWGRLVNCRTDSIGELYADLEFIKSHPMTEQILEQVERFEDCGLSHDADGHISRDDKGPLVTEIRKVFTVDFVLNPATNQNLYESEGQMTKRLILDVLRENVANPLAAKAFAVLTESKTCEGSEMEMKEGDNPLDTALRSAIMEILDGESSLEEKLSMIRDVCSGGKKEEPAPAVPAEMEEELKQLRTERDTLKESLKVANDKLQEEATKADRAECVQLLESKGREANDITVTALLSVAKEHRAALVENFTAKKDGKRPDSSPPKYRLKESTETKTGEKTEYQLARERLGLPSAN